MTLDAVDVREGRVLRLCLTLGLCERDQLVAWADGLIARLDDPPYELTEISMAHVLEGSPNPIDALLGEGYSANEIVTALSRVNPDEIGLKALCCSLGMVADMAMSLDGCQNAQDLRALGLLHHAFEVHDGHYFLEIGETTEASLRQDVTNYFRRIRELAADLDPNS